MDFVKRLPTNLTMTAPSGSITTIPKWFWYGTRRLLPMKNTLLEGISILLQSHPMSETDYDYLDAILSTRRTDSAPTTTMDLPTSKLPFDYFPETPSTLTGDLFSPHPPSRYAARRRLKMAPIPHLTTRATSPLGWFCKTAFKVSMKVIFCVICFYYMFDNSVRSFAHNLWLTISADSLPSFYHVQRVWADPLRANSFCLVLLFCQFIIFDHIKVFESATSSSTPLEFTLAAPPLPHRSSRRLLICRPLSLCSLSFSLLYFFWVTSSSTSNTLGSTGTGFSSCSNFTFHQNLGRRLSYCASFNLSFLCFGITSYLSQFLFIGPRKVFVLHTQEAFKGCGSLPSLFRTGAREYVRRSLLLSLGVPSFCEYLISLSIYLSSLCSWFAPSYPSCSSRSLQRMISFLSLSRTLCRE